MHVKFSSKKSIFLIAFLLGVSLIVSLAVVAKVRREPSFVARPLTPKIAIAQQLTLGQLDQVRRNGFATVIDIRPDGEAPDETPSTEMGQAARASKLRFAYIPVAHGDIPDSAVTALGKVLADSPQPVLLYCRSGRRAARTWGLMEASRPDGLDADAILSAVHASGQSADDLAAAIAERIARRSAMKK